MVGRSRNKHSLKEPMLDYGKFEIIRHFDIIIDNNNDHNDNSSFLINIFNNMLFWNLESGLFSICKVQASHAHLFSYFYLCFCWLFYLQLCLSAFTHCDLLFTKSNASFLQGILIL